MKDDQLCRKIHALFSPFPCRHDPPAIKKNK
jgi:hypothetical protein